MSVHAGACRRPRIRLRIVTAEYSAHHLQVLEGLEAVRKRPGMYIGSTDSRGLMHCLWEIIDNAVDEALAGHGTRIDIVLHADGSVEVRDRARGIPVDIEPRTGLTGVEVVFTKLHAGGKFGGGSYAASGGLHGVGASVVNALSERLDVEVDRGGKTWAMSFHRGEPGVFADKGEPRPDSAVHARSSSAASCASSARRRAGSPAPASATGPTGRSSRRMPTFQLDELAHARPPDRVPRAGPRDRRRATSAATKSTTRRRYRFDGGISEFVEFLAHGCRRSPTPGACTGTGTFTETVPVLQPTGAMVPTEVERECDVDIALRWGTGYDTVDALVRQHHRDAQGRHAPAGLRAGAAEGAAHAGRAERPPPEGRQRQAREGRRPRRASPPC